MSKTMAFAFVAFFFGGLSMWPSATTLAADAAQNKAAQQAEVQLPNGFQQKDLHQLDNIRDQLAAVIQDAITRGDFGKVIDNLAVVDRDRMKDYKNQDFKVLDGVAGQINQDWKQKYGHPFNITGMKNVFTDRQVIAQGVVTDANVASANFPAPAEAGEQAHLASSKTNAQEQQGQAEQVERKDLQQSKGIALLRLPADANLPEITGSLIEEGGNWRIAVPATISSQQIHTQLQNQLTYFGRDMKQWPADEADAYRQLAHHVLMALYDVNAPEAERAK